MLKLGAVLDGKYKIISVIGQGGMSTVYLARHQRLNKEWAVKEISREYCENYEMISRQLVLEADILKKLNHPGLPKIIDIIEKKDVIWMVMEFIEGKTLKEVLKERGRIQETEVLSWGKQLCEVLSYLHSRTPPIIYRDLKPDNIILKKTGRLVLIDFGTAREYCYAQELWTLTSLHKYIQKHAEEAGYPRLSTVTKPYIQKFLKEQDMKPFKIKYYCEKRDPDFESKMHEVLLVYKQIEMQFDENGDLIVPDDYKLTITVSYDEKPGIQAISNTAPDFP